jgi:hypothetical protein
MQIVPERDVLTVEIEIARQKLDQLHLGQAPW